MDRVCVFSLVSGFLYPVKQVVTVDEQHVMMVEFEAETKKHDIFLTSSHDVYFFCVFSTKSSRLIS